LEALAGRPASKIFDLIIGTSTGAFIGAAAALAIPAARIEEAYMEHGPLIFKRSWGHCARRLLVSAPYTPDALCRAIRKVVGDDIAQTALKDLDIPLALTSVSHTREEARLFCARKFSSGVDDLTLEDAIISSAAAPTYFPAKQYKGENLIDGGIVANAPELVGLALSKRTLGAAIDDIRILAIALPPLRKVFRLCRQICAEFSGGYYQKGDLCG
jgi:patatin-like phospholipase/acyl hydrolase